MEDNIDYDYELKYYSENYDYFFLIFVNIYYILNIYI